MKRSIYHLGLIGYPLGHSFSPRLHTAALFAAGLSGDYNLFPIPPDKAGQVEMEVLIARIRQDDLHGLNVTIPHKQLVMRLVDERSPVARATGAVNTLYMDANGRLVGDNTDVPGFLHDLGRLTGIRSPGQALILGAGGSARAVVYGLGQTGWQVQVLSRRGEQAAALVDELSRYLPENCKLSAGHQSAQLLAAVRDFDLLVNTTPQGMYPNNADCPWPEDIPIHGFKAVYDLVYNPLETVLVRRARSAGLPALSGAGMLVAQAALAFQCWTGIDAPFEVMERAFYEPQS